MQIEYENSSAGSSEPEQKSGTSEVTLGGRHELVDASCPLTSNDLNGVAEFREKARVNAWDLIAVHSPWSRAAAPESRGKQPVGKNWQVPKSAPELHTPIAWSANTGMLTAGLRVFDVDIDDRATVDEIVATIARALGVPSHDLMIRRRSNSARVSILFRAAAGAPRKIVLSGRDKKGNPRKVEVLGAGQQFVVDGWHASCLDGSARITWQNSPADTPRDRVTALSEGQVDAILREIANILGDPKLPPPSTVQTAPRIPSEKLLEIPGGKLAAAFEKEPLCGDELAHHDQLVGSRRYCSLTV
jgi:hypothetical protein